jgi:hypothetical protein
VMVASAERGGVGSSSPRRSSSNSTMTMAWAGGRRRRTERRVRSRSPCADHERRRGRDGRTGRAPREGRGSVGGASMDGRSTKILLRQCPAAAGGTGSRGPARLDQRRPFLSSSSMPHLGTS